MPEYTKRGCYEDLFTAKDEDGPICTLEAKVYEPLIKQLENQSKDGVVVQKCLIDACTGVIETVERREKALEVLKNAMLLSVAVNQQDLNDKVLSIIRATALDKDGSAR
jgi:hypothetical protein